MAALSKWVPIGMAMEQPIPHIKLTTIDKIGGIYCHICNSTFGNKKDYDTHYKKHETGSTDITYTCVVCRKDIVGYPSFRGHCYTIHVMKDKFKCNHCDKMFSKQTALKSHFESMHQFKCSTCQNRFQSQKELTMHQIIHKNDQFNPPYNCQVCNKLIEDTNDCEQHLEDHCTTSYSCPVCEETINNIQQDGHSHLAKHFDDVLTENEESDYEENEFSNDSSIDLLGGIFCSNCNQNYKTRSDFDAHFMLEHADKNIIYGCNVCGKEYEKYLFFANHCYNHCTKDKFKCEVCSKRFPRLSLLVIHTEAYHSGADPYTCRQCGLGLPSARRLRDHRRADHNCSSVCPEQGCGKIFSTPKELAVHLGAHGAGAGGGGGGRCRRCGLRLGSLAAALRHLPLHRRTSYACPVCARRYIEKHLLMKHITQHFSSVLHVCKICGRVYSHRHRLMAHMKVHNEAKQHICHLCGKGFAKRFLLKQHENIHTGAKPYKCTNCPKTFASVPNYKKHMKKMHNVTRIDIKVYYNETKNTEVSSATPSSSVSMESLDNPKDYEELCDWKLDELDPHVMQMIEQNLEVLHGTNNISEIEADLWVPSPTIPIETTVEFPAAAAPPREYGPELVTLDDYCLPHIPPLLTINSGRLHEPPQLAAPQQDKWEPPVLTKLADMAYADLAEVMNADII